MSAVNNGGGAAADQKQNSTLSTLVGPAYTTYGSQFAIKRQRNANIMLPTLLLGARRSTLHGLRCSYKASCSLFSANKCWHGPNSSVSSSPTQAKSQFLRKTKRIKNAKRLHISLCLGIAVRHFCWICCRMKI